MIVSANGPRMPVGKCNCESRSGYSSFQAAPTCPDERFNISAEFSHVSKEQSFRYLRLLSRDVPHALASWSR
jgi:hypothetical protein